VNRGTPELEIARADPAAAPVRELLDELDEYLNRLYPPESNHPEPLEALRRPQVIFLCARNAAGVAGCAAAKLVDDGQEHYGELKRIFVKPALRGRGIARDLVAALEQELRARGVVLVRLEAGVRQPEALALYRKLGYRLRGPFGSYRDDPHSLFLEKRLA